MSDRVTKSEDLEAIAQNNGVTLHDIALCENEAMTVELDGAYHIGLSSRLSARERKSHLAHELGHTQYAGLYKEQTPLRTRSRIEYRANKWAFMRLCPPGAIKAAVAAGANGLFEIAEALELPETFVRCAVETYQAIGSLV